MNIITKGDRDTHIHIRRYYVHSENAELLQSLTDLSSLAMDTQTGAVVGKYVKVSEAVKIKTFESAKSAILVECGHRHQHSASPFRGDCSPNNAK